MNVFLLYACTECTFSVTNPVIFWCLEINSLLKPLKKFAKSNKLSMYSAGQFCRPVWRPLNVLNCVGSRPLNRIETLDYPAVSFRWQLKQTRCIINIVIKRTYVGLDQAGCNDLSENWAFTCIQTAPAPALLLTKVSCWQVLPFTDYLASSSRGKEIESLHHVCVFHVSLLSDGFAGQSFVKNKCNILEHIEKCVGDCLKRSFEKTFERRAQTVTFRTQNFLPSPKRSCIETFYLCLGNTL